MAGQIYSPAPRISSCRSCLSLRCKAAVSAAVFAALIQLSFTMAVSCMGTTKIFLSVKVPVGKEGWWGSGAKRSWGRKEN